jgi:hypothetical protein
MKKIFHILHRLFDILSKSEKIYDILTFKQHISNQKNSKNPFNKYGSKCFSQSDEDGLTLEIVKRIGIKKGTFLEFGVGNGTENNSLILLSLGWKGCWVGDEKIEINIPKNSRLKYYKEFVTLDNCQKISKSGLDFIKSKSFNVISMDLDGNDYYLTKTLLETEFNPELFIVEYNGKFIPPILFKQNYNSKHLWANDDYFGCSLSTYVELFRSFDYKLICCNSWTGANAFFVKNKYSGLFPEVPKQINEIYNPPFYHVRSIGHPINSIKTIESILDH